MTEATDTCPLCGGSKLTGTTTFTADIGSTIVVVRGVPARECAQCGESWLDDATATRLETIVEDARAKSAQVEITQWQDVA